MLARRELQDLPELRHVCVKPTKLFQMNTGTCTALVARAQRASWTCLPCSAWVLNRQSCHGPSPRSSPKWYSCLAMCTATLMQPTCLYGKRCVCAWVWMRVGTGTGADISVGVDVGVGVGVGVCVRVCVCVCVCAWVWVWVRVRI